MTRIREEEDWNQYAVIRTKDGQSRRICIRRGVRQGCIISPVLFNLYSEYMMKEFDDEVKEIVIGGRNFNNLRYADDAVYQCCSEVELQEIITRLAIYYDFYEDPAETVYHRYW